MVLSGDASSDLLDILQPSSVSSQMISEVSTVAKLFWRCVIYSFVHIVIHLSNDFQMEEGFSLLKSAFEGANLADEKMACILIMAEI